MPAEPYEQWRARCLNVHALSEGLQKIKAPRTQLERDWWVSQAYRRMVRPGMSVYERAEVMAQAERAILPVNPHALTLTPEAPQNAANQATVRNKPILAITPYQPEQVALAVIGEAQDRRSEVERDRYGIPTSYKNKSVDVLLEHLEAGDIYCAEKKDQYRHYAGEERIAILSISPRIEDKSVYSWGETRVDRYRLAWVCHEDGRKELVKLRSWLSHYRVVGGAKLHAAQDTRNILIPFKMTTPVWKGTKAA